MLATVTQELYDPKDNIQVHIRKDVPLIETDTAFSTSNFHPELLTSLFYNNISENIDEDFSQTYFWTDEWQQMESESDEDIRTGRIKSFNSVDDLITELNS
ncbi:MAG: hypothetical protein HY530_00060 [Chloroflexi bacterium]|nr:hypothetical protein [Chloroflexota bacterium]